MIDLVEKFKLIEEKNEVQKISLAITGCRLEDPQIIDVFEKDQLAVLHKYGLPSVELLRNDPSQYERELQRLLVKNGVDLRSQWECGDYFINDSPTGKSFDETARPAAASIQNESGKYVSYAIDRSTKDLYVDGLTEATHEGVHALQALKYPLMPPEMLEYEAYLMGINVQNLRALNSSTPGAVVFSYLYMKSVDNIYGNLGKKPPYEIAD